MANLLDSMAMVEMGLFGIKPNNYWKMIFMLGLSFSLRNVSSFLKIRINLNIIKMDVELFSPSSYKIANKYSKILIRTPKISACSNSTFLSTSDLSQTKNKPNSPHSSVSLSTVVKTQNR